MKQLFYGMVGIACFLAVFGAENPTANAVVSNVSSIRLNLNVEAHGSKGKPAEASDQFKKNCRSRAQGLKTSREKLQPSMADEYQTCQKNFSSTERVVPLKVSEKKPKSYFDHDRARLAPMAAGAAAPVSSGFPIPLEPGPVIIPNPLPKPTPPAVPASMTPSHLLSSTAAAPTVSSPPKLGIQALLSQAVNNLSNPFFVKPILENTIFSFPLNTTQYWSVLSQAKDNIWEMQRINFLPNQWNYVGNMNYQGTSEQVIIQNAGLNQSYQQMLTAIQKIFPEDQTLDWLNFNQGMVFPTILYQPPSNMSGDILTLKVCGSTCQDEWLGFYQLNQGQLGAYFKHAGAAYLFGIQNSPQLSLILALVAKDQAEVQTGVNFG